MIHKQTSVGQKLEQFHHLQSVRGLCWMSIKAHSAQPEYLHKALQSSTGRGLFPLLSTVVS